MTGVNAQNHQPTPTRLHRMHSIAKQTARWSELTGP
jgi:hypothetical protein